MAGPQVDALRTVPRARGTLDWPHQDARHKVRRHVVRVLRQATHQAENGAGAKALVATVRADGRYRLRYLPDAAGQEWSGRVREDYAGSSC